MAQKKLCEYKNYGFWSPLGHILLKTELEREEICFRAIGIELRT
jgi:hypothetical protein